MTTLAEGIGTRAHPLAALDPTASLTDLEPLHGMARDANVVALGVAARDTHELSLLSHRILRFLVTERGFRALLIEGDDPVSIALDEYVRTGAGDPRALLAGARSFWRTEELLDAVRWLRAHNESHPTDQIRIVQAIGEAPQPGDLGEIERQLADTAIRWHEHTGHKIVYWGGIAHTVNGATRTITQGGSPITHRTAGSHLRKHFGAGYLSVGLTFLHGTRFPVPPEEFVETVLGSAGPDAYLLDLRGLRADRPTKTRLVGPSYDPADDASYHLSGGSLGEWFDVIAHWRQVTPVHLLGARSAYGSAAGN